MKEKKIYSLTEKEYNDLMSQLVTSDNLIATDKEKYLKEEPELFWKTDNSKQIKMLESKTPIQPPESMEHIVIAEGKCRYEVPAVHIDKTAIPSLHWFELMEENNGKKVKLILEVTNE